jgi:hypothetical protein
MSGEVEIELCVIVIVTMGSKQARERGICIPWWEPMGNTIGA